MSHIIGSDLSGIELALEIEALHERVEFDFFDANIQLVQLVQIGDLGRLEIYEAIAAMTHAGTASHSMHIVEAARWRVVLNDPVDVGHVEASGCHVLKSIASLLNTISV